MIRYLRKRWHTKSRMIRKLWKLQKFYNLAKRDVLPKGKELTYSVLRQLHDVDLRVLVDCVQKNGSSVCGCIMLPVSTQSFYPGEQDCHDDSIRQLAIERLFCLLWRWPNLTDSMQLKKLIYCVNSVRRNKSNTTLSGDQNTLTGGLSGSIGSHNNDLVCCNPYHWSILFIPDVPLPPYSPVSSPEADEPRPVDQGQSFTPLRQQRTLMGDSHHPTSIHVTSSSGTVSTSTSSVSKGGYSESGDNNYRRQEHSAGTTTTTTTTTGSSGSGACAYRLLHETATDGISRDSELQNSGALWCQVAYWEKSSRVGRLFHVSEDLLSIFQDLTLPDGTGMSLAGLQSEAATDGISKVRLRIGRGVLIWQEDSAVYLYNRSNCSVFVSSAVTDLQHREVEDQEQEHEQHWHRPLDAHHFGREAMTSPTIVEVVDGGIDGGIGNSLTNACSCSLSSSSVCTKCSNRNECTYMTIHNGHTTTGTASPCTESTDIVEQRADAPPETPRKGSTVETSLANAEMPGSRPTSPSLPMHQVTNLQGNSPSEQNAHSPGRTSNHSSDEANDATRISSTTRRRRRLRVHKLPSEHTVKIFDFVLAMRLMSCPEEEENECAGGAPGHFRPLRAPAPPLSRVCELSSVRLSFVKGWSDGYRRPVITECPCWVEIYFQLPQLNSSTASASSDGR